MNGPALLALQLLDSQLDALEGRRKRLPERAALDGARAAHAAHAAERSRLEAIVADRDVRAAVALRIVSAGGALTRLADLQPSLEEVYTRYFQEARHAA